MKNAEALGANAVLNTYFDDSLDVDTFFHGAAVVIEPSQNCRAYIQSRRQRGSIGSPPGTKKDSTVRAALAHRNNSETVDANEQ
ncbi:MAG: hypothetical protein ACRD11_13375 [Terriglobia bacterium]